MANDKKKTSQQNNELENEKTPQAQKPGSSEQPVDPREKANAVDSEGDASPSRSATSDNR